jgi:hypothetical protein
MKIFAIFSVISCLIFLAGSVAAQDKTPLDDYFEKAQTILIGRCVSVGALNILLQAKVEVEALHVLKGNAEISRLSLTSRIGMKPGEMYLIRIPDIRYAKNRSVDLASFDSVIPLGRYADLEVLKALPPRIVVLRTINQRIDELESLLRNAGAELEEIRAVKKGN